MTTHLHLDSGWQLRAVSWPAEHSQAAALPARIPAQVPGTVHTDLLAAGLIDDPYLDLNEMNTEWIGHTVWEYSTVFQGEALAAGGGASEGGANEQGANKQGANKQGANEQGANVQALPARHELVCEGLDTVATITLNGHHIAHTYNQHRSWRFDITHAVLPGENRLSIRFDSAWEYAESQRIALGDRPNAYTTPFQYMRKMAANFGWDWGPQLVTAGVWKPARIETVRGAHIIGVQLDARPHGLDEGAFPRTANKGTIAATVRLAGNVEAGSRLRVSVTGPGGVEARTEQLLAATPAPATPAAQLAPSDASIEVQMSVELSDVHLWWPHGHGDQPLYDVTVELLTGEHPSSAHHRRVGFRTVELDTAADAHGSAFRFIVNGAPIVIRGANWIPDDCFIPRLTAARYRERVTQARDANLNLLRVWGGGIFERDEFFDACDELGVLTWQDFLFACAAYPEEAPLWQEVEAEARDNVARIAHRPSLVLLNGCNENIWGFFDWDWQGPLNGATWGLGYYTELLPRVCAELAPNVPYWAGSPFSGTMDITANAMGFGNQHLWEVWNRMDYANYQQYRPRFVSEFGFQGPPTWSTLTQALPSSDVAALAPDSPALLLHQKADDGNGKLARGLAPHLPEPHNIADWHYVTQLNQARAIVFGTEWFRSQSPTCMGTIVWQLNDCWPVTSWAAVDGFGRRKPLWHALRRANAPRLLTLVPRWQAVTEAVGVSAPLNGVDATAAAPSQPPASARLTDVQLGAQLTETTLRARDGELVAVNDGAEPWSVHGTLERVTGDGVLLRSVAFAQTLAPGERRVLASTGDVGVPGAADTSAILADEVLVVRADGAIPQVYPFVEDVNLPGLAATVVTAELGSWVDGVQEVTLSANRVARGVCLFVDRVVPEAFTEVSDIDVLPDTPVTVTVWTPTPLTAEQVQPGVVLRWLGDTMLEV